MASEFMCSGIADEAAHGLDGQLEMHKSLGWRYIELRNIDGSTIDTMDGERFETVVSRLAESRIKVSCLASDVGKLLLGTGGQPFENDVMSLKRLIGYCNRLDCGYIRVMAYRQGDLSDSEWKAEAVSRLRHLACLAVDGGVRLALENCVGWHSESGQRMVEFLEAVDSPGLVCLYDTGNVAHIGADSWTFYQQVREHVRYVHVKDALPGGKSFTYPGEGISMVPEVLTDLWDRGYSGFVSIEPHMASSAHLPHMAGGPDTAWERYGTYGSKLNALIEGIKGRTMR